MVKYILLLYLFVSSCSLKDSNVKLLITFHQLLNTKPFDSNNYVKIKFKNNKHLYMGKRPLIISTDFSNVNAFTESFQPKLFGIESSLKSDSHINWSNFSISNKDTFVAMLINGRFEKKVRISTVDDKVKIFLGYTVQEISFIISYLGKEIEN